MLVGARAASISAGEPRSEHGVLATAELTATELGEAFEGRRIADRERDARAGLVRDAEEDRAGALRVQTGEHFVRELNGFVVLSVQRERMRHREPELQPSAGHQVFTRADRQVVAPDSASFGGATEIGKQGDVA